MKITSNTTLGTKNVNQKVELYGFVHDKRKMNNLLFVDLRDRSGIVQVVFEKIGEPFPKESVLKVEGKVVKRKAPNPYLQTGQIEVVAEKYELISKPLKPLPFVISNDLDAKEDTLLSHRFLDLRREVRQKNLVLRAKIINALRRFLEQNAFLEIETPILSRSTPEGARDFLVPTRKHNSFFALPQSPQLYKQMIMAAGFEKYFQFARVFRDEDSRKDRQPEFTQLDIELSYAKEEDIKLLVEDLMKSALGENGFTVKTPFPRMDFTDALNTYGNDHPDVRFGLKLQDFTGVFATSEFRVLRNATVVKGLVFEGVVKAKQVKKLVEIAKKNKAQDVMWACRNAKDKATLGPGFKFINKEIKSITKGFKTSWTVFLVGDELANANQALGAIRVELNNMFHLANKNELSFVWIENFLMFEQDETTRKFKALHHPFTSVQDKFQNTFDKPDKILKAKAKAYDLVLNGVEIGGGSVRNNDLETQNRVFRVLGMSQEETDAKFGFFTDIFSYGLPNHLGIAFGVERILMVLTNANSIRDFIAFPKNAKAQAVLEKAPSAVNPEQLSEYFIKLEKK